MAGRSRFDLRRAGSPSVALIALATMVAAVPIADLAIAHTKAYPNSVTVAKARKLGPAVGIYNGRVLSARVQCKRNREVQVFRVDVTPEVRLFTTRTRYSAGGLGYWKRKGPALPKGAKVQALIETKVLAPFAGHDHTCPVDRSAVRTVPYP